MGPFGITLSRSRVVDFTDSFYFDDRSILAKKGVAEINPWGFLYPLTESVWAVMGVVLALVWLLSMVLLRRPKAVGLVDWSGELLLENIRVLLNQGRTYFSSYFQYIVISYNSDMRILSVARKAYVGSTEVADPPFILGALSGQRHAFLHS